MKGRSPRKGRTFRMTVISLLPEGRKESSIIPSDFVIAGGHLYYLHTEDSASVIVKKTKNNSTSCLNKVTYCIRF